MKIIYDQRGEELDFALLSIGAVFQCGAGVYLKVKSDDRANAWDLDDNEFVWFNSDASCRLVDAELHIK